MATTDDDRALLEHILSEYARLYPYSYGDIQRQTVFDRAGDHYRLLSPGWDERRVHGCLVPIDLIGGKFWIQRDGPEEGIALDLEAAGIPKGRIVLAFRRPESRAYTDYAGT